MPDVTVLVDDALWDRLPYICARDGVPTPDRLLVRSRAHRPRHLPSESLSLQVPFSEGAFDRLVATQRRRDRWAAASTVSGAAVITALATGVPGRVAMVVAACLLASLVLAVASLVRLASVQVRAHLDESCRWVTLTNVDPVFASAAAEQAKVQQIRLGVPAARRVRRRAPATQH